MTDDAGQSALDKHYMALALDHARLAAAEGEVPVGALVVSAGEIIGAAGNRPIGECDPTAHAEIRALRAAARQAGNYRLPGATLYVSLEPCTMCAGAMVHARIARLVFGAREPKAGAILSTAAVFDNPALNHRIDVTPDVLAAESAVLLRGFFEARRQRTGSCDAQQG